MTEKKKGKEGGKQRKREREKERKKKQRRQRKKRKSWRLQPAATMEQKVIIKVLLRANGEQK